MHSSKRKRSKRFRPVAGPAYLATAVLTTATSSFTRPLALANIEGLYLNRKRECSRMGNGTMKHEKKVESKRGRYNTMKIKRVESKLLHRHTRARMHITRKATETHPTTVIACLRHLNEALREVGAIALGGVSERRRNRIPNGAKPVFAAAELKRNGEVA